MSAWQGIVVPAATPKEIVARLNAEVNKAVQNADLRQAARDAGRRAAGRLKRPHYAAYIKSELGRWSKVVKDSGAKVD